MQRPSIFRFNFRLKMPLIMRYVLIALAVVLAGVLVYFLFQNLSFSSETISSGGKILASAQAADTILPFGDRVLVFDGQTIECFKKNGEKAWEHNVADTTGGYQIEASDKRIILYKNENFFLIDENGDSTYRGNAEGPIQNARCGETIVALEVSGKNTLYVVNRTGAKVDEIDLGENQLMNFGMYSSNDLLWALSLNTTGLAPVSRVDIYKPGRETVNSYQSTEQLYYAPSFHGNDVYLLGTHSIDVKPTNQRSNYSVPIYGWEYLDDNGSGDQLNILLKLSSEQGTPSIVKVVTGNKSEDLSMPVGTIFVAAGEKALYAVTPQSVTALPYAPGEKETTIAFRYTVDKVLCNLHGKALVVSSGENVHLVQLP